MINANQYLAALALELIRIHLACEPLRTEIISMME
jgi:hypothetical protein